MTARLVSRDRIQPKQETMILRNLPRTLILLTVLLGGLLIGSVWRPSSAGATSTLNVTLTDACSTAPGGLRWAVDQANSDPTSADVISIASGLQLEFSVACSGNLWFAEILGPVRIEGNGAAINEVQQWYTNAGVFNSKNFCPPEAAEPGFRTGPSVTISARNPNLFRIGTIDQDNSAVVVEIEDFTVTGVSAFVQAYRGSSLNLENVTLSEINDIQGSCDRSPIQVDGDVDLTISNSTISENWSRNNTSIGAAGFITQYPATAGPGTLRVVNTTVFSNLTGYFATWAGDVDIVTSRLSDTGGLLVGSSGNAANAHLVNTAWVTTSGNSGTKYDRIEARAGATIVLRGSTVRFGGGVCRDGAIPCSPTGLGVYANGGEIRLEQSAISGTDLGDPILIGDTTRITSDGSTWVQPNAGQDGPSINAILPNAMVDAPGLPETESSWPASITPLLGSPSQPGVLLDVLPDADCPSGSAVLLNPIDNSCITVDALGNSRWDTGNNTRNIGAVQLTLSPHLVLVGGGNQTVDLSWSRPLDPSSGAITGYSVFVTQLPGGPETRVDVAGVDTLSTQLTGLNNGTRYLFKVVAVNNSGDGPLSNVVSATPSSVPGTPNVTATPGPDRVDLSWIAPPDGGSLIDGYLIQYREVGSPTWQTLPLRGTGTNTSVTSLNNGVDYEFRVAATNRNGTGPFGLALAQPESPPEFTG